MREGDTRAHPTHPPCSLQRSPSCCSTDLQEGGFQGALQGCEVAASPPAAAKLLGARASCLQEGCGALPQHLGHVHPALSHPRVLLPSPRLCKAWGRHCGIHLPAGFALTVPYLPLSLSSCSGNAELEAFRGSPWAGGFPPPRAQFGAKAQLSGGAGGKGKTLDTVTLV